MPQDLSQLLRKNLLALGSAAVLTVYSAGYVKTRAAAAEFDGEDSERRPAPPVSQRPSNREALPPLAARARPRSAETEKQQPQRRDAEGAERRRENAVGTAPAAPASSGLPPVVAVAGTAAPKSADSLIAPSSAAVVVPVDSVELRRARAHARDVADSLAQAAADSAEAQVEAQRERARQNAYFKDGTYTGWGTSRHGDIQATVEIHNGRITAAWVSQCLTRYSCSWIASLPPQVVSRQSADVDYVSGATQSTNAFYQAVYQALTRAQ